MLQPLCQDVCHGCCCGLGRRSFLQACGAAVTAGAAAALYPRTLAAAEKNDVAKVRVAAVFLSNISIREIWPYPGFDTQSRQQEVLTALNSGCPNIEFTAVTVTQPNDVQQAVALKEQVDGYFIYTMTLDWSQGPALDTIAQLGKPTLVADEFLGGSGLFLTRVSGLRSRGRPTATVSSTRLDDVVKVARLFATAGQPGTTPESFARECDKVYRSTFPPAGEMECVADSPPLREIGECVRRLRESRFLIVGTGQPGQQREFLGANGRYIDFEELKQFYEKVDEDRAQECAAQWTREAQTLPAGEYVEPRQPTPEAVRNAAAIYLLTLALLKKYDTDTVTMNCLGGFAAGRLPAYPCLGFMQLLNDGGQGVCEAMPDDTISMLMARILTGRPGFVSDPCARYVQKPGCVCPLCGNHESPWPGEQDERLPHPHASQS